MCVVGLLHQPETGWLDVIAQLRNGLEAKYGPARETLSVNESAL